MSEGFTMLWGKILDSSVWQLDGATRLVWITLLAMKNRGGIVPTRSSVAIANRARVSLEECRKALRILSSPDRDSGNREHEGRRIEEVDEGWRVMNHENYRYSSDARRALWREIKAVEKGIKEQAKEKVAKNKPAVPLGTVGVADAKAIRRMAKEIDHEINVKGGIV